MPACWHLIHHFHHHFHHNPVVIDVDRCSLQRHITMAAPHSDTRCAMQRWYKMLAIMNSLGHTQESSSRHDLSSVKHPSKQPAGTSTHSLPITSILQHSHTPVVHAPWGPGVQHTTPCSST
eukprot:GHUV01033463.1.p2 GENE.GHUV01033463.1~~GHUV01033463.1.p2  ORF type:complete len:121 (-),score=15.42 GHUV01033463.1:1470-1832(-)